MKSLSLATLLPFVLSPRPKTTDLGAHPLPYVAGGSAPSRTKKSGRTTKAKRKAQKIARRKNRSKK